MTLEVIKFRDTIKVRSIPRFVPGVSPPMLEIIGEDFSSVEEVLINSATSPEFMVVSNTRLWAALPSAAQGSIRTVEVISAKFTKTAGSSSIQFKIGTKPREISGILKLTQLFTKWMLQSPGSDIFAQSRGGGIQKLVGQITSTRGMEPVMAAITQAVQDTSSQLRAAQIRVGNIPADESLLSAELLDFGIFEDRMEAQARIRLQSVAGDAAVTNLEL